MNKFSKIKKFYKENKKTYIIGILWLAAVDISQLILPRILGSLTDAFYLGNVNNNILVKYTLMLLFTGVFAGIGRYFWRVNIAGNSAILEYNLRKDFFEHILTLSPNYYYTHKTGDLMSHATNDISTIRQSLGISIIMLFDSLFILIIGLIMMVKMTSMKLTIIAVINLPIIILFTKIFGDIVYNKSKAVQESFSTLTENTQENYSGIRVIKAFSQEDYVYEEFKKVNRDNYDKTMSMVKVSGFFEPMIVYIYSLSIFITILLGGNAVINGSITLGEFIAFNSYLAMLHWPIRSIGLIVNNIQRGLASLDRLNNIFYEESDIKEIQNPIKLDNIKGHIRFENVSFKYPKSKTTNLKNINLDIKPGQTLAIVGRTGSGKSTLASLLLRLYDSDEGKIKIDNIDIKDLSLETLRSNIAFVSQDNFLFSTTIGDNIAFSCEDESTAKKEDIIEAAKNADVYKNIVEFPDGFNTILGERGITLSGGQKQRTSIARAFFKDSPILILDDSLSAVDTETEKTILKNINEISNNKTNIIISHRVSTIKDADEIIFLENGKIVERGQHKDLIDIQGEYYDLYQKQLLDEEKEEEQYE